MPDVSQLNYGIVEDLKRASLEAFKRENYLEASIIVFQTVEVLLRLAVRVLGEEAGVPEPVLKRVADDEQSFPRLITALDLVHPQNGLSERLTKLNHVRNDIVHRLFYRFETVDEIKSYVSAFCLEAISINQLLRDLVHANHSP